MSIAKIQSGDKVKVISGSHKGSVGIVKKVFHKVGKATKVSLTGIPKITKFRKAVTYNGEKYPGMITYVDRKIDITNVSLVLEDGSLSKVKIVQEGQKKIRQYKKTNAIVLKQAIPEEITTNNN